jgi:hypothetical protein
MALGDDKCKFDHSQNDELRMRGMTGDDEDDNVQDDVVAAFGQFAADPHPRDDDDIPVHAAATDPEGDSGDSEVAGSNRPSTSAAWEDFDKMCKKVPTKKNPIRYGGVCKHCKKKYFVYSANGTGCLTRHLKVCVQRREKCRMSQTHIGFNPDGSVRSCTYNADLARVELVRMLARLDLPLMIGETDAFKEYIKKAHNPVSKQTTGRDLFKYYSQQREKLITYLQDNVVSSVTVTSDIWFRKAK